MRVRELMHGATVISPELSVLECAKIMSDKGIGSALVKLEGHKYEMVTERDILFKIVAAEADPKGTKVTDIMSELKFTIDADERIRKASEIFNLHHVRRLPVVENDEIRGVITSRDVARYTVFMFEEFLRIIPRTDLLYGGALGVNVKEIMHGITEVSPDATVSEVAKIMRNKCIGSVLVKKEDGEHGIATERDILIKVIGRELDPPRSRVKEIMSDFLFTINADEGIQKASEIFNLHQVRRLPIMEDGRIIGIITTRDVAKYSVFAFNEALRELDELNPEQAKVFEDEKW